MPLCCLWCLVAFLAFLVQPVTLIFVFCLSFRPFWARNSVGITSLLLHRLPLAARAENLPWGRVSSKVEKGVSGTVLKVVLVMPCLLMNVVPTKSTVTPLPCRTIV